MRKLIVYLWLALLFTFTSAALADSAVLSVTTDDTIHGVSLMDENGQTVSRILDQKSSNGSVDWTLSVSDNGASTVTLYAKDANGNWIMTDQSYEMSWFFSNSGTSQANQTSGKAESQNPWPTENYQKYTLYAYPLPEDERVQSRCGPSRNYHGAGAYKTYKMTSTNALFVEDGYVLVDLDYTTVGKRRVYFLPKDFEGVGNVPTVTLSSYPAKTTKKLVPTFGPGSQYDSFKEAAIASGTSLSVFFEEDGWVFAEFDCKLGLVRAWIPVNQVAAQ
ncbi:MAG: hypothetical protein RR946_08950 [Clostridia bacterium]